MYITTKVLFHIICAIDLIMEDGALFFCECLWCMDKYYYHEINDIVCNFSLSFISLIVSICIQ